MKKTAAIFKARTSQLNLWRPTLLATAVAAFCSMSSGVNAQVVDPLYPCLEGGGTAACVQPHRIGPWSGYSYTYVNPYPGCDLIKETPDNDDPLVIFNSIVDWERYFQACTYRVDAAYRLANNIQPIYQYGESCLDATTTADILFPYYTMEQLGAPSIANPGEYYSVIAPPNPPKAGAWPCSGPMPYINFIHSTAADSFPVFAKYSCPTGYTYVAVPASTGTCIPINYTPPENPKCENKTGDPVDTSSGHQVETHTDYTGANGLIFTRNYSSGTPAYGNTAPWSSTAEFSSIRSVKAQNSNRYSAFVVFSSGGAKIPFRLNNDNTLAPVGSTINSRLSLVMQATPSANALTMDSIPVGTEPVYTIYITGFTLTNEDGGLEQYDYTGTLLSRTAPNNSKQFFSFSGSGEERRLNSLSDSSGRTLTFAYNNRNQLVKMTDPAGGIYTYSYAVDADVYTTLDADRDLSMLISVTYPDLTTIGYTYNQDTQQLASIIDQNNQTYAAFTYSDIEGSKSVSTQLAGGIDNYAFAYEAYNYSLESTGSYQDPDVLITHITDPSGTNYTRTYYRIAGIKKLMSQSQPAGSGCAASSSSMDYTSSGKLLSSDDFNGKRTCHYSEGGDMERNLDTSVIEGLSSFTPCKEYVTDYSFSNTVRATTNQWHPDAAVRTALASPKHLSRYVYNGQPDPSNGNAIASCMPGTLPNGKAPLVLCKTIENATLDSTGITTNPEIDTSVAAVTTSMSYNAEGQVTSIVDPLGAITQLAYYPTTGAGHTKGDLASTTNASGFVTTFDIYNAHGDVLQSTSPKGLVTTLTYDAMRRLLSASAGGLTESYTYTPFGAIATSTAADGGVKTFSYDAAHRLTSMSDAAGNVLRYTLDNAGGVTGQSVESPQGEIASSVTRVFDALHRVQQITGAAQ